MATDYAALKTAVEFYCDRADTADSTYDMFFRLACEKLNNALRVPEMIDTLTLAGSSFPYQDTNRDILEIDSVYLTRGSNTYKLEYLPIDKLAAVQTNDSGGTPRYFTTVGMRIDIGPEPASTDSIDIVYFLRQEYDLNDGGTNIFISYYESIILYLMLGEMYQSLHDSTRSAEYKSMASAMLEEANLFAWKRRYAARLSIKNA